jgi:hypothetical protein
VVDCVSDEGIGVSDSVFCDGGADGCCVDCGAPVSQAEERRLKRSSALAYKLLGGSLSIGAALYSECVLGGVNYW